MSASHKRTADSSRVLSTVGRSNVERLMTLSTSDGGGLLLQRLGKFARALLLRLEQSRVLDGDHRLIGEGLDQLDLLLGERPYGSALQDKHANWNPLSKKWHAEDCAKVACTNKLRIRRIPDHSAHLEFERTSLPTKLAQLRRRVPACMSNVRWSSSYSGV